MKPTYSDQLGVPNKCLAMPDGYWAWVLHPDSLDKLRDLRMSIKNQIIYR
jgi:hypothetical protein